MGKLEKSGSSKKSSKLAASTSEAIIKTAKEVCPGQSLPSLKSPKNSGQQNRCKTQSNKATATSICSSPAQKSRKVLVSPSKAGAAPPDCKATLKRSPVKAKEALAPTEPAKSVRRKESPKQTVTRNHTGKSPGLEMHGSTFVNKINRGRQAFFALLKLVLIETIEMPPSFQTILPLPC